MSSLLALLTDLLVFLFIILSAGDIPDPHLAAGALCVLLSREPLVAIMFFRIETKASEVWDGVDTTGPRSAKSSSPRRSATTPATALTVAERTAKNTRSVFAAQFLRAFHLSTRGSCAPWPANAYPLLQLVTATIIDRIQSDGSVNFLGQWNNLSMVRVSSARSCRRGSLCTSFACH